MFRCASPSLLVARSMRFLRLSLSSLDAVCWAVAFLTFVLASVCFVPASAVFLVAVSFLSLAFCNCALFLALVGSASDSALARFKLCLGRAGLSSLFFLL